MSNPDLNLKHVLLDGEMVACPRCDGRRALTLARTSPPLESWPAWLGCGDCGHGGDHPTITNGLVAAAMDTRTGREKATDRDVFVAEWRGRVLAGECVPEWTWDDARIVGKALTRVVKTEVNGRKREAKSWWRGKKREARAAVRQAAKAASAPATAAALGAAWDLQTGGADGSPKKRRCTVTGCKGGWLTITTRAHSETGRVEKKRVQCAVCRRAT